MPKNILKFNPLVYPDCDIIIVGDYPRKHELAAQQVFQGPAGRIIRHRLKECGVNPNHVTYTYLCPFGIYPAKPVSLTSDVRNMGIQLAKDLILKLKPNIVIALGTDAMEALTPYTSLQKYRGSVYYNEELGTKVICTYSPEHYYKVFNLRGLMHVDFQRAVEHSATAGLEPDPRKLTVCYKFEEAMNALDTLFTSEGIAFDIETALNSVITHIAFSGFHQEAFCIPFSEQGRPNVFTLQEESLIWRKIHDILTSSIPKYAQNAQYDIVFIYRTLGIPTYGLHLDTMAAAHELFVEFKKSLGFLCSLYIDIEYYKDEIGSTDPVVFCQYNAKDACVTREIGVVMDKLLRSEGLAEHYWNYVHPLFDPLMEMQVRGVACDETERQRLLKELEKDVEECWAQIKGVAGEDFNPRSSKQKKEFLYEKLGLPVQYNRKTKKPTTDKNALEKLYALSDNPVLHAMREYSLLKHTIGTLNVRRDDGRWHTSYNVAAAVSEGGKSEDPDSAPVSGRLSSRKDIFGNGTNLQNVSPKIRSTFTADPGYGLLSYDLSQVEARIVAYEAQELAMIAMFERGEKIHQAVASKIYKKPYAEVGSGTMEYVHGKRVVHGTNYCMGEETFAEFCGVPRIEARRLLAEYKRIFPRIDAYHNWIRHKIYNEDPPTIYTPLGRRRIFFDRACVPVVNSAASYIPQSTAGDFLNRHGLFDVWFQLRRQKVDAQVLLQVHDEVVLQYRLDDGTTLEKVKEIVESCLSKTITIHGRELSIPYELGLGKHWGELK